LTFFLESREVLQGAVVGAVEGVEAGLEAVEVFGELIVDGEWMGGLFGFGNAVAVKGVVDLFPKVGFDAAEAAETPFGVDEDIDEGALFGGDGLEALKVLVDEVVEVLVVFVEDDEGVGVDAGFEGILAGGGFAGRGAGSGRELGVAPVGVELFLGGHGDSCSALA
jgi:hypothetical protein